MDLLMLAVAVGSSIALLTSISAIVRVVTAPARLVRRVAVLEAEMESLKARIVALNTRLQRQAQPPPMVPPGILPSSGYAAPPYGNAPPPSSIDDLEKMALTDPMGAVAAATQQARGEERGQEGGAAAPVPEQFSPVSE